MYYIFLGDNIYDIPVVEDGYEYLTDEQVAFYLKNIHRNPKPHEVRALMMDADIEVDLETYKDKARAKIDEAVKERLGGIDRDRLIDSLIDVVIGPHAVSTMENGEDGVPESYSFVMSYNDFRKRIEAESERVKTLISNATTKHEVYDALYGSEIGNISQAESPLA